MKREEAIHFAECLKNNWTINFADMEEFCDMAIEALSAEPTDLISKSAVMETIGYWTTTEEWGNCFIPSKLVDMINELPSADTQTSGDLISRADAIEAVEGNSYGMGSRASIKAIKALPSADRPSGEWKVHTLKTKHFECDNCGKMEDRPTHYCPNCGAKMGGNK